MAILKPQEAQKNQTAHTCCLEQHTCQISLKKWPSKKKSSTLRELYYISEAWELGKFGTQNESNNLIEDLEIITKLQREDFKIRPEEDGAKILGNLVLTEINRKGKPMRINCREDVGDTGYNIPYNVEEEKLTFNSFEDSRFILAIETGGMFDRLVENGFDETHKAIILHTKGQPARSTRRFLRRMQKASKLPVLAFTDADPWSYRIYGSMAYGAIKTAHISHLLANPKTHYLGVTPSDIVNYDLPSDSLTDRDINSLNAIKSDPRFQNEFWTSEIDLQLELGKKSIKTIENIITENADSIGQISMIPVKIIMRNSSNPISQT